jgi:hypothetical protein
MLTILKALSDHNSTRVLINGQKSRKIVHQVGLWQGTILSPIIYAYFIDDLPLLLARLAQSKVHRTSVASLLYADDIALIAHDRDHMQALFDLCVTFNIKKGFRFSPAKCKVLCHPDISVPLCIYDEPVSLVKTFVYLGVSFGTNGIDRNHHVQRMIGKAISAMNIARGMGIRRLGARAVTALIKSLIYPIVEYGAQVIPYSKHLLTVMDKAIMVIAKKLLCIANHNSSLSTRWYLNILPMSLRVVILKAKWLWRTMQLPDSGHFMVKEVFIDRANGTLFVFNSSSFAVLLDSLCSSPDKGYRKMAIDLFKLDLVTTIWNENHNVALVARSNGPGLDCASLYR